VSVGHDGSHGWVDVGGERSVRHVELFFVEVTWMGNDVRGIAGRGGMGTMIRMEIYGLDGWLRVGGE
jgi:hypothetical protein